MNPSLPTRMAVATVLGCVGILLLSACGFGALPSHPLPILQREDFVIWQPDPAGGPERPIGIGTITGFDKTVSASIKFTDPACLAGSYNFRNTQVLFAGRSINFRLFASPQMSLSASAHTAADAQSWFTEFPLEFTLSPDSCGSATFQAEARDPADLEYTWTGHFKPMPITGSLRVVLYQARSTPTRGALLWGDLFLSFPRCQTAGRLTPLKLSVLDTGTYTFVTQNNQAVIVEGLPQALEPDPPPVPSVTATFIGGPCDGRVITAALSK